MRAPRAACLCVVVVALSLGQSSALFADYRQSYRQGVEASDLGDWSAALQWMEKAIAERGQESDETVKIHGMVWEPYVPYYYLGLAAFRLGRSDEARRAWAESQRQGVIQHIAEKYEKLRGMSLSLPTPPAVPTVTPTVRPPVVSPEAVGEAQKVLGQASAAQADLVRLRSDPACAEAWEKEQALAKRAEGASSLLSAAQKIVGGTNKGGLTAGAVAQARAQGESALDEFLSIANDLRARRDQHPVGSAVGAIAEPEQRRREEEARRVQALGELETAAAEARKTVAAAPPSRNRSSEMAAKLDAVDTLLGQVRQVQPSTPGDRLRALRDAIVNGTAALRRTLAQAGDVEASASARAALREAASAYLGGDYAVAIKLLATPNLGSTRATAAAYLLRGASELAAFWAGGADQAGLESRGNEDVASAFKLDDGLVVDPDMFSPRFLELAHRHR